jgi:hypothetical protein
MKSFATRNIQIEKQMPRALVKAGAARPEADFKSSAKGTRQFPRTTRGNQKARRKK